MTRWMHPPELERSRERDRFDPIREGERYGLLPKLSLAIWKRVSEQATDIFGRRNEDRALAQFHELAARITARGRRLVFQLGLCGPDWRSTSRARIVRSLADGACFAADSVGRDSGRSWRLPLADLW
jgi:hypothetical protein